MRVTYRHVLNHIDRPKRHPIRKASNKEIDNFTQQWYEDLGNWLACGSHFHRHNLMLTQKQLKHFVSQHWMQITKTEAPRISRKDSTKPYEIHNLEIVTATEFNKRINPEWLL